MAVDYLARHRLHDRPCRFDVVTIDVVDGAAARRGVSCTRFECLSTASLNESELRKDPVTGRWVIISTERRKRPTDFRLESVHDRARSARARSAKGTST